MGAYFEASIFADLKSLIIYAGVHEVHFGIYYRKISTKFPYAIYYTIETDLVRIHAVADTRRDPVLIEDRLSEI